MGGSEAVGPDGVGCGAFPPHSLLPSPTSFPQSTKMERREGLELRKAMICLRCSWPSMAASERQVGGQRRLLPAGEIGGWIGEEPFGFWWFFRWSQTTG